MAHYFQSVIGLWVLFIGLIVAVFGALFLIDAIERTMDYVRRWR